MLECIPFQGMVSHFLCHYSLSIVSYFYSAHDIMTYQCPQFETHLLPVKVSFIGKLLWRTTPIQPAYADNLEVSPHFRKGSC